MKLAICLFLFLIVFLFGWFLYKKSVKKILFFQNFESFLGQLETEIGFFQSKINDIVKQEKYGNSFNNLITSFDKDKKLTDWQESFLSEQEICEVKTFFAKLGRSDSETETNEIRNFKIILDKKLEHLKSVEAKKAKLKFSLITMLGLLLFVILI